MQVRTCNGSVLRSLAATMGQPVWQHPLVLVVQKLARHSALRRRPACLLAAGATPMVMVPEATPVRP